MHTIWKYELAVVERQEILMPVGSQVLSVAEQRGAIYLWVLVERNARVRDKPYVFNLFGTGHALPEDDIERTFIGTVQQLSGALVWHVFEEAVS
jgi:hypothetical protein